MRDAIDELNAYEKAMGIVLSIYAVAVNFSVAVTGICFGAGIMIMLTQYFKEKALPSVDKRLLYAVLIYIAVWLGLCFFSLDINASLHAWGSMAYRFLPMFFGVMYIRKLNQIKYIMLCYCLGIFVENIAAYYQIVTLSTNFGTRVIGCTENPNDFANLLVLFIPAMFFMGKQIWQDSRVNKLLMLCCLCSVISLGLTQTRGAWLALAVMIIVAAFIAKEYRKLFIKIAAVGLASIVLLFAVSPAFQTRVNSIFDPNMSSNLERSRIYTSSINMIKDYPVAGVGLDNFEPVFNDNYVHPEALLGPKYNRRTAHPHNNMLMMLTEGGIIGFAAYAGLYTFLLYLLWKKYKKNNMMDNFALMGIFVCLGLHLEGLTEMNIGHIQPMRELWFLLGISLCQLGEGDYK